MNTIKSQIKNYSVRNKVNSAPTTQLQFYNIFSVGMQGKAKPSPWQAGIVCRTPVLFPSPAWQHIYSGLVYFSPSSKKSSMLFEVFSSKQIQQHIYSDSTLFNQTEKIRNHKRKG